MSSDVATPRALHKTVTRTWRMQTTSYFYCTSLSALLHRLSKHQKLLIIPSTSYISTNLFTMRFDGYNIFLDYVVLRGQIYTNLFRDVGLHSG